MNTVDTEPASTRGKLSPDDIAALRMAGTIDTIFHGYPAAVCQILTGVVNGYGSVSFRGDIATGSGVYRCRIDDLWIVAFVRDGKPHVLVESGELQLQEEYLLTSEGLPQENLGRLHRRLEAAYLDRNERQCYLLSDQVMEIINRHVQDGEPPHRFWATDLPRAAQRCVVLAGDWKFSLMVQTDGSLVMLAKNADREMEFDFDSDTGLSERDRERLERFLYPNTTATGGNHTATEAS